MRNEKIIIVKKMTPQNLMRNEKIIIVKHIIRFSMALIGVDPNEPDYDSDEWDVWYEETDDKIKEYLVNEVGYSEDMVFGWRFIDDQVEVSITPPMN